MNHLVCYFRTVFITGCRDDLSDSLFCFLCIISFLCEEYEHPVGINNWNYDIKLASFVLQSSWRILYKGIARFCFVHKLNKKNLIISC